MVTKDLTRSSRETLMRMVVSIDWNNTAMSILRLFIGIFLHPFQLWIVVVLVVRWIAGCGADNSATDRMHHTNRTVSLL